MENDSTEARTNEYEARQEERRQRLLARAAKYERLAQAHTRRWKDMSSVIPLGQPILVGH